MYGFEFVWSSSFLSYISDEIENGLTISSNLHYDNLIQVLFKPSFWSLQILHKFEQAKL